VITNLITAIASDSSAFTLRRLLLRSKCVTVKGT
jgi:hypothetical protein